MKTKRKSKLLAALLAVIMLISALPMSAFAAPASDIPSDMLNNDYLDALAYTGYNVQAQKTDGTIFKSYGYRLEGSSILSGITYGYGGSGLETVSKSGTATGLAPNIATFQSGGLCCAAYVSYVYYNYLPNMAGIDTSGTPCPSNPRSASAYNTAANNWVSSGKARRISFTQSANGDNFAASEEIPIGSLIIFKSIEDGSIAHVAIYAGYYKGVNFVTHVGNDRGPEINSIEGMTKGGYPEAVAMIVVPEFVESAGRIEIYKKDPNGKSLAGAYFTATNTADNKQYPIGPTNSSGYAYREGLPFGTYKVVETVFPENYTTSGTSQWTVTLNSSNKGIVVINAVNKLKTGSIEVYKKDVNGANLSGAVFTVYDSTGKTVTTIGPTNSNGYAAKADIPYGNYRVVETTFPKNYKAHGQTEWNVTVGSANNGVVTVRATNELKKGYIEIIKTDAEDGRNLSGAEFTVYDNSGKVITVIGPTNSSGYAKSVEITYGNYIVRETKIPEFYQAGSKTEWSVKIDDDAPLITLDVTNDRQYGSVRVIKIAEDGLEEGLVFSLTGRSVYGDSVDMTATVDENGIALFERVPIGSGYVLSEKNTPKRYVVPADKTVNVEWNKVTESFFENILKKWRAELYKLDAETLGNPQGDATLAGAVYGVYKDGQLLDTYTIGADGKFITDYYVCGDGWTIREITPSEGYLLDKTVHKIPADPGLYVYELNTVEMTSYETVKIGNIAIIKHTNDGSTQLETPEVGAEFEVYLKKSGSYANAKESERDILTCDEHGFSQSKDMPYGVYVVHQTKGWEGREFLKDFDVFISENGQTYRYLANNANFQSYIKVIKTDAESGLTIPYAGAAFQLYDPDGNKIVMSYTYPEYTEIDTFYTTEDGMLITPQKLPYGKGYSLVEVTAPYGYVLDSTPIFFNVAADTATADGAITVVKINRPNMPQKGIIKITKTGEVFQSVIEQSSVYQPVYEIGKISGAVFEIRAAEDIYTLDGVMHYAKGELVDTVTTGSDGIAVSKQLYLGKYEIKEITAPHFMVLNDTIQTVELTYAGQKISVTEVSGSLYNERQKVKVSLDKALEQNELFGIGMNGEIANISFGLYAAEDIIATDGTKLPANGLIEIISFDKDGHAVCQTDLPLGKYYLQERSTDSHYILNDAKFPFEFTYAGQDIEVVEIATNNGEAITNNLKYGSVSGLKLDEDGKTIAGAKFGLFRNDETEYTEENALMTAVSGENGIFRFDNIPVGTWVVRELVPAEGFVLNEQSYQITISEHEQVVEITLENRYIRSDILGHKVDEDGEVISGVLFGLFKEGTDEFTEETAFMTAESDENGIFRFEQIRYGKWIVKELHPADGFIPNEKLYEVTVAEDGAVIEFTVENKYIRGNIEGLKVDEDGKAIEGAVFGLFREDEKEFTEQNMVMTAVSGSDGKFLFENVRYGKWLVKELSCPEQYVMSEEIFEVVIKEQDETITITAVNKHVTGKVQAVKISSKDHDKLLSGAEFEIYLDVNGNQTFDPGIDTLIGKLAESETGFYEMDGLRHNGYFLFESKAPEGFQKDDRYFYFQISADGETVMVENEKGVGFVNEPVPTPHEPGDPSSPQTGDNSHILLWIMLASGSLIAVITLTFAGRKKRKSL
ncbi:MAG: SpaA isopeptide-forming pilin-related protein [Monoglobaceae bacterium]